MRFKYETVKNLGVFPAQKLPTVKALSACLGVKRKAAMVAGIT